MKRDKWLLYTDYSGDKYGRASRIENDDDLLNVHEEAPSGFTFPVVGTKGELMSRYGLLEEDFEEDA